MREKNPDTLKIQQYFNFWRIANKLGNIYEDFKILFYFAHVAVAFSFRNCVWREKFKDVFDGFLRRTECLLSSSVVFIIFKSETKWVLFYNIHSMHKCKEKFTWHTSSTEETVLL